MKALVYGAGRMGKTAGWDLERHGVEVDYADVRAGHQIWVDGATDDELVELIKQYDVLVACADYSINDRLTKVAIEAGTHMCDLGGNNDVVNRQLAMSDDAERAGVIVIPDCGLAPGMAGLLAAAGIEELGGEASEVYMRVGGLPQNPVPPLNYMITWSVKGLINEYMEDCEIISDCQLTTVPALTDAETITIDDGIYEAFRTSGGLSTMARTYRDKVEFMEYKTIRYPGHATIFRGFKSLGFFEGEARTMLEEMIAKHVPNTGDDKVYVQVEVISGTEKQDIVYELIDRHDGERSAMARTTAFSAATVAYLLANGDVTKRGVWPGEIAIPLNKYIQGIRDRGLDVRKR